MPFLILKLKRQLKLISEYKHRDYIYTLHLRHMLDLHYSRIKIKCCNIIAELHADKE